MEDLNNLRIFSLVVKHNGFTGAARALGIDRSSICRRISRLEEELGVRLIQRSTRRFAVTELGMEFHGYCEKMVSEAKAGYEKMAFAKAKPSGVIRMSCPAAITQLLIGPLIPLFISKHPEVRIALEATDRRVDIDEKFDLSIRLRQIPSEDSGMVMRSLGMVQQVLVASRSFLERHGRPDSPAAASRMRTISYGALQGPHVWQLIGPDEQEMQTRFEPTLVMDEMCLVRQAVMQGLGIAQLPLALCLNETRQGLLEIVLPEFLAPLCEIQVVFPTRRGMLPAVRSFIDFLSAHCVSEVEAWQIKPHTVAGHRDSVRFWTNRHPLKQLLTQNHSSTSIDRTVTEA